MTTPGGSHPNQPTEPHQPQPHNPQQPPPPPYEQQGAPYGQQPNPYGQGQYQQGQYQQGQYPQGSQYQQGSPYAPAPPRKSGMRTAGKWMFLIGLPMLIVGIILTVIGFGQVMGSFDPADFDEPALEISGPTAIELNAGAERSLSAQSTSTDLASACTVTGPSGPVTIRSSEVMGEPIPNLANFTADAAGEHVIECSESGVAVGPPIDPSSVAGGGLALLGGFLLGGLGFLLALIGAILWLIGRSRENAAR